MNFSLIQMNSITGALEKNFCEVKEIIENFVEKNKTEIIVFPKNVLSGCDLHNLEKDLSFLKKILFYKNKVKDISKDYNGYIIMSEKNELGEQEVILFNKGEVFSQKENLTFSINNEIFFITNDVRRDNAYLKGVNLVINLENLSYYKNVDKKIGSSLENIAEENAVWLLSLSQFGAGQYNVYLGGSRIVNPYGETQYIADYFLEEFINYSIDFEYSLKQKLYKNISQKCNCFINLNYKNNNVLFSNNKKFVYYELYEMIYKAIVLGIKDYMAKNKFTKVVLGLSGGMDSALVSALAVDAIGKENVLGLLMPSEFSSKGSIDDSINLANNLGIKTIEFPIKEVFNTFNNKLCEVFKDESFGLTQENLQARIRGMVNMAFSNKYGYIVLTTGNKSECSVGYSTLYGDTCGSLNPIKDLYKTEVYKLAEFYNVKHEKEIIPGEIFNKPPSAELRPGQKDEDSLPAYDVLDKILFNYIEKGFSIEEIIKLGYDEDIVKKVINLLNRSEYKRRQGAIGIKVSKVSFDEGYDKPLLNYYR